MSYKHLSGMMFDVETLGRRAGCVILSIGAVRFDIDSKTISDEFYVTIDAADSKSYGLHTDPETLEWLKAIAPVVISTVEDGSLCALTKDAQGNALYLHSNNFDGYNYEKAVRKALELHYDRFGEIAEEIPFSQSMPRLVDEVDDECPLPYQINRIKYMVRDDHLALCVPFNETMVAAADLANCGAFRFDDELMITNIFSPTKTEAKCLYDNLQAYRKFKEEMKKWR